jgi:ribosomal protein S18 acetylase RimI-like enzyme
MLAGRLLAPRRLLPDLEFRRVEDEATRLAFCSITSEAFNLPLETSREIYGSEALWRDGYTGFVGYQEGEPVTTAALLAAGGVAGIYSVATSPRHRNRGCAEAVVRHAVEQARRETGVERSALQTSRLGRPLYERMGYRVVTGFSVYA